MKYVEVIRKALVDELKNYSGKPVILDLDKDVLSQILFDDYRGTKSFARELYSILEKINFSNVCFDNVNVGWVDFSKCVGVKLNPQTVAKKDLRATKLKGVEIIGPFDGVRIESTKFTGSKGAVINPQTVFDKTLSSTELADTIINGSFDGCSIYRTNFTGSCGAVINPQTIRNKNLGCILNSATIIENGNFDSVDIRWCNFTGVKGEIKINPQTIYDKNLIATVLAGVDFIGPFDGVRIGTTDFTGSKGAIINPQTIKEKDLVACIFNGVTFTGPFDDCVIVGSDFTGSKNAVIDKTKLRQPISGETLERVMTISRIYGCNLKDTSVFDNLNDDDYSYAKLDGAYMINPKIEELRKKKEYCISKIRRIVRKNNNGMNR